MRRAPASGIVARMRTSFVAILIGALGRSALAAPPPAITFPQALAAASACPGAAALDASARAWQADVAAAPERALAPRLTVGAGPGDGWAWQAELTGAWVPGKHAAARAAALAAARHAGSAATVAARDCRLAAAAQWLAAAVVEAQLDLADAERREAAGLVALAERALAGGVATRAELAAARAYQQEIELRHLDLEGALREAELALAAVIGEVEPIGVRGPWPAPGEVARLDDPAVAASAAAAAAAARRSAAARQGGRPQLEIGVRVDGDRGATAALALVGVTLGSGDRGALDAAAAAREARLALADAAARTRGLALDEQRTRHEIAHADERVAAAARRVAALADQVAALTAAQAAGEVVVADLVTARRAWLGGRVELVAARGQAVAARAARTLRAADEVR